MQKKTIRFTGSTVDCFFDASFRDLKTLAPPAQTVLLTDENIFGLHPQKFRGWNTIVLKPGEKYKVQATVDSVVGRLIDMGADRTTTLVGVGGGVVTDLAGYVASVFLRGVRFGFVPTSLLAMVDAAIGGKNGIDIGVYKNMIGTIRQPSFLLYDHSLLKTLPEEEWRNGFAEIIKHACICNRRLFSELEKNGLRYYRQKREALQELVYRNALIKLKLVQADETEQGERKLLNFGHTLGHALENLYALSHGEAIAIGMAAAADFSAHYTGFREAPRVAALLRQYGLPTEADFDKEDVFAVMTRDKKRAGAALHFILLERIGKALIRPLPLEELKTLLP